MSIFVEDKNKKEATWSEERRTSLKTVFLSVSSYFIFLDSLSLLLPFYLS